MRGPSERLTGLALALTIAVVLADSSVVTLGLPDILREFDGTVVGVSWVLTAFNLALALAILPAVKVARATPRAGWAAGVAVFALASLACALADSEAFLIGARVVQALGGALAVACSIELIARSTGSHERAAPIWAGAATIGVAVGPAAGGLLTELLSWQAIFLVQVPLLVLLPLAYFARPEQPEPGPEGPSDLRPEVGLALLSAGLTAALFLLVILLTEGWGLSPLTAALTVSAIPLSALLARLLIAHAGPPLSAALAGGIAIAGGLAAMAVLPGASLALTLQPQLLIGVGLALALPVLTLAAVGGRDPLGSRSAATIAARHAGIVVGILVLAPVLSSQLETQRERAQEASTALLLDAPLPPETKVELAEAIGAGDRGRGRAGCLTWARPSPRSRPPEGDGRGARQPPGGHRGPDRARGHQRIQPALPRRRRLRAPRPDPDRAPAHRTGAARMSPALRAPMVALAVSIGLIARLPRLRRRHLRPRRRRRPLRGARRRGRRGARPFEAHRALGPGRRRLRARRVSREELTLALASEEATAEFAELHDVDADAVEDAVRAGLETGGRRRSRGRPDRRHRGDPPAGRRRATHPLDPAIDGLQSLSGDDSVQSLLEQLGGLQDLSGGELPGIEDIPGYEELDSLIP